MDPVEIFPAEITESIFLHLKGNDAIKTCTLVSRSWNDFIGSSLRCMEKLRLRLEHQTELELKTISRTRKYRNVLIVDGKYSNTSYVRHGWFKEASSEVYEFMKSNRFWKKINLSYLDFPSTSTFNSIVATFETSAVAAVFHIIRISDQNEPVRSFKFQRLRRLHITNGEDMCQNLFVSCTSLDFLRLSVKPDNGYNINTPRYLFDILQMQKKLKHLQVDMTSVDQNLDLNYLTFPCEVEELGLSYPLESFHQRAFFLNMLTKQRRIKKLNLIRIGLDASIMHAVLGLNSLKELSFHLSKTPDHLVSLPLPVNKSIEILDIHQSYDSEGLIKMMIKTMPNLKKIVLGTCDRLRTKIISENVKNLEEVAIRRFLMPFTEVHSLLPNVKLSRMKFFFEHYLEQC